MQKQTMGLLKEEGIEREKEKVFHNKVAPSCNDVKEYFELENVKESRQNVLNNERKKRRKKSIFIRSLILLILIIVAIIIFIPVAVFLTKKGNSKGTNPTQNSNLNLSTTTTTTFPTTNARNATDFKTVTNPTTNPVTMETTKSTSIATSLATTESTHCFQSFPSIKSLVHQWKCTNGSHIGSKCTLSCLNEGFMSLNTESVCASNARWSSTWTDCFLIDACKIERCAKFATCQNTEAGNFSCSCNIGYAGNGIFCANDTDADGIPDYALNCTHLKSCRKDNCILIPNSGQEDADRDGNGDACDDDDDNDGILDSSDNCQFVANREQNDTDADGVGDACDNCIYVNNTDQTDTNSNGIGDACDIDADSDGITNHMDNCVHVYNADQKDADKDGIGDACDNCPNVFNKNQIDDDDNLVGDACQHSRDSDFDGIDDHSDNCISIPNGDQTDTDLDSIGDACDGDIDADKIANVIDNCPFVANPDQSDKDRNGIGDACEGDDDGDGVDNDKDDFPLNSKKNQTDFRVSDTVIFDGKGTAQDPPKWFQFDEGRELLQTVNGNPGALLSKSYFGNLVFTGTLMVQSPRFGSDDDYVGLIFGFQSNRKFYVCSWKKRSQSYSLKNAGPYPRAYGRKGISLKKFHSETGPGISMRDALWETGNSANQSTLLWFDESPSWKFNVSYQWKLVHNPQSGMIRISWFQGTLPISDSGILIDKTLRGGRVGVFVFSQENVYFSALKTKIPKIKDYAIELNGNSSFINIGHKNGLFNGNHSFTIDLWTRITGVDSISCMPPRLIDFGNFTNPKNEFLNHDKQVEREWTFASSFFPVAGIAFDNSTGNGIGNLAFFNARWTGRGPYVGDRARLVTPWFPVNKSCSLKFSLYMMEAEGTTSTNQMGSFQIEVRSIEGVWEQVLLLKGNQGRPWTEKNVLLMPKIHGYKDIQVRFTAVRGRGSSSSIGIDELRFGPGCGDDNYQQCNDDTQTILGTATGKGPFLSIKRAKIVAGLSQNVTIETNSSAFKYGKWNHVVMNFNQSKGILKIFANGKEVASKKVSTTVKERIEDLLIGRMGNEFLKGYIDEVRIWKGSPNITELYSERNSNSVKFGHLVGEYRFKRGEGNMAKDGSTSKSNARIYEAKWVESFLPNL